MRRAARSHRSRCAGPTRAGGEGAAGISVRAVFFLRNSRSPASAAAWIKAERQFVGTSSRVLHAFWPTCAFHRSAGLVLAFLLSNAPCTRLAASCQGELTALP
jgi:hypothetical protein